MTHEPNQYFSQGFKHWLDGREIVKRQTLSGGDICNAEHLTLSDQQQLFIKSLPADNRNSIQDMFLREAESLQAISESNTIPTPEVLYYDEHCLVLEYLPSENKGKKFWQSLGEQLAALHAVPQPSFGFSTDNYCGLSPQQNTQQQNGYQFFAEQRLLFQAHMALEKQLLKNEDINKVEQLCKKLPQIIPEQEPSLIHGDLWNGNIFCRTNQRPVLIDPACHWGWREADIAMTQLFGGFDEQFYKSYEKHFSMEPGWQSRMKLYNLYHLLNHLNLFGSSYYPSVMQTLQSYL